MIPAYIDEQWSYCVRPFDESEVTEMCFPDENYNYDEMKDNSVFIGAYDNGKCIGLAILQDAWFKYMHLYDLKVSKDYRHMGVASHQPQ
ncbi:MAG: GNAT family N-acetyltransferase [Lachnospiraceae bacterium]|nr:GNAT family N-acetyltransferase [Lachnospiraceae bacterium]